MATDKRANEPHALPLALLALSENDEHAALFDSGREKVQEALVTAPLPLPDDPRLVAALFVDPKGVYSEAAGVELWDEARDARLYAGPWPVVAHPPCKRWCRFAPGVETRFGYKVGDDGGCFEAALRAVRTFGGVLEHPAYSLAWRAFGLPRPIKGAGWLLSLDDPGMTCYVEQERYGHSVKKGTWLYAVGVEPAELPTEWRADQTGGKVRWSRVRYAGDDTRPRVAASELDATPTAFRDVLLGMARTAVLQPA